MAKSETANRDGVLHVLRRTVSTFNAPLREVADDPLGQPMWRWNNVAASIDYYRQHGVPARRLVLGVPFYGKGFQVSTRAGHGLYQPYAALFDAGNWRDIRKTLLPDPRWERHRHPVAQAPWLYHAERKFVSYEDPASGIDRMRAMRDGRDAMVEIAMVEIRRAFALDRAVRCPNT